MRRRLSVVMAGGALLVAAPVAWGATVTFQTAASCRTDCLSAGIAQGDLVIGFVEISTDGFSPSGAITRDDLVDFGVTFAETPNGVFKPVALGYAFSATWGAAANAITGVSFTTSGRDDGPFISFGPEGNVITLTGTCLDADCTGTDIYGTPATLGPVTYRAESPAPIPLPATGALAAAGSLALAAVAWLRRGRRRAALR